MNTQKQMNNDLVNALWHRRRYAAELEHLNPNLKKGRDELGLEDPLNPDQLAVSKAKQALWEADRQHYQRLKAEFEKNYSYNQQRLVDQINKDRQDFRRLVEDNLEKTDLFKRGVLSRYGESDIQVLLGQYFQAQQDNLQLAQSFKQQLADHIAERLSHLQDPILDEAAREWGSSTLIQCLTQQVADKTIQLLQSDANVKQAQHKPQLDWDQYIKPHFDKAWQSSIDNTQAVYQQYQIARKEGAISTKQSLLEHSSHKEDTVEEGLDKLETSSDLSHHALKAVHRSQALNVAKGAGIIATASAGLSFLYKGWQVFKKNWNDEPIDQDEKEDLAFFGVNLGLAIGSIFFPPLTLVMVGSWFGYAVYKDYKEKYHDRVAIDEAVEQKKQKIQHCKDRFERLNQRLVEHLQSPNHQFNAQKVEQIKHKIKDVNQQYIQALNDYKTVRQTQKQIDKQRSQRWWPNRTRRNVFYGACLLAGVGLSAVVPPLGLAMTVAGLAGMTADNDWKQNLTNVRDWFKRKLTKTNQNQKHPSETKRAHNPAEDSPAQQNSNDPEATSPSVTSDDPDPDNQSVDADKKKITQGAGLWQRIKSWFNSGKQVKTHNQDSSNQPLEDNDESHESTAGLLEQMHGDQASVEAKREVQALQKDKHIQQRLALIVHEQDYAQALQFIRHVAGKVPGIYDCSDEAARRQRMESFFRRFKDAPAVIGLIGDFVSKFDQAREAVEDDLPQQTIKAIKDDNTLLEAVTNFSANQAKSHAITSVDHKSLKVCLEGMLDEQSQSSSNQTHVDETLNNDVATEPGSPSSSDGGDPSEEAAQQDDEDRDTWRPYNH